MLKLTEFVLNVTINVPHVPELHPTVLYVPIKTEILITIVTVKIHGMMMANQTLHVPNVTTNVPLVKIIPENV